MNGSRNYGMGGARSLRFILQAGNWSAQWQLIEKAVPLADEMGFWGFLMPDHYMWGEDRGGNSTLETWTTLSYLAGKTKRLKLGTLVTPIPFRPPGILAKEVSTLDVISGGRTILGIGAGWSQTEFEGYSICISVNPTPDPSLYDPG
jgi:alkanesulfonate monooxygenase SsuD/methylene tetrahydromethanopterin reductase-like flavin-dependent oxidoreductase (luciferase family)